MSKMNSFNLRRTLIIITLSIIILSVIIIGLVCSNLAYASSSLHRHKLVSIKTTDNITLDNFLLLQQVKLGPLWVYFANGIGGFNDGALTFLILAFAGTTKILKW